MSLNLTSFINTFLLAAIVLLLLFCKSTQPQVEEAQNYTLIVLLASERATPDNIDQLAGETIIKRKRSSRSQNQWLLKISKKPSEIENFIDTLKESTQIKSVELSSVPEN